jgi:hypothetical protein
LILPHFERLTDGATAKPEPAKTEANEFGKLDGGMMKFKVADGKGPLGRKGADGETW